MKHFPGINIFLMMSPEKDNKEASPLVRALKEKAGQDALHYQEISGKLSDMLREFRSMPKSMHIGGG